MPRGYGNAVTPVLPIVLLVCWSTVTAEDLVDQVPIDSRASASSCEYGSVCHVHPGAKERPSAVDVIDGSSEVEALMQKKFSVLSKRRVAAAPAPVVPVAVKRHPAPGQDPTGLTLNAAGDLGIFLSGLASNLAASCVFIVIFMLLKERFPVMYKNNVAAGIAPFTPPDVWFGWARAAFSVSVEEMAESIGLDNAMLLGYVRLCLRTTASFGLPMILIMGPLNYSCGGQAAGEVYLSYLSIANVQSGCWLFWIHAFVVWGVVIAVQVNIYSAMRDFLVLRHKWLLSLPVPRATTVLVEGIPAEHQTDAKLREFFSRLFEPSKIKSAYLVKRAPLVKAAFERKKYTKSVLSSFVYQWEKTGRDEAKRPRSVFRGVDQIQFYTDELQQAKVDLKLERTNAATIMETPGGINGCNGFVTFYEPKDAQHASGRQYGTDLHEWAVSVPPPAASILWRDLEQEPGYRAFWAVLGYLLTVGLYCLYLPSTIWITDIANQIKFPGMIQSFWASLAPTLGLQFMVAFLPTFLLLIFRSCFTLIDDAWAQQMLQNWYYVFQLVFVILIAAIGQHLYVFMLTLVTSPLKLPEILAQTMPPATHFYMNLVVTTWSSHALNLTRWTNMFKFLLFKRIYEDDEAKRLSEPEDQDYYGLGSRHARFTTLMSIGIVFGQLCPPIPVLVFVNFIFCRLVYGYLINFAESKKPDLGGEFFAHACKHLFVSCGLYVLLMTGILFAKASSNTPGIIAALSIPYVLWSFLRFNTEFSYEKLPFDAFMTSSELREGDGSQYVQPEWIEDDDE